MAIAREITVTDRRVHLPSVALALAERQHELQEFQGQLASRFHVAQETEARNAHVIRVEAQEVVRRAEEGMRSQRELEEYQGQLAFHARTIQDTETRHAHIINEEARELTHRLSEGQQHDRQALAAQLAGAQSAYAAQAHAYTIEMQSMVAVELQSLQVAEQQVRHQMNENEQRCAHEVNAARHMARQEVGEAAFHHSRHVQEVARLEGQEQEAARQVLIRQQRLLVLENDQSKMARHTSDSLSAGRDATIAELELERKALIAHEMFWYQLAERNQAQAEEEMMAVERESIASSCSEKVS